MYNAQSVIERVQSALKSAGISQKAMLQDCGMSENTLKRMNDERGMSSFYLARIADYLGVSVDYLLGSDAQTKSAPDDAAWMMHSAAHAPQEIGRTHTNCTSPQFDFAQNLRYNIGKRKGKSKETQRR